jgi:hypothetical protein
MLTTNEPDQNRHMGEKMSALRWPLSRTFAAAAITCRIVAADHAASVSDPGVEKRWR